jgi:EmrB/QacA subfamily drug resistance transporter
MSTESQPADTTSQEPVIKEQPRYSKRDTLLTMVGVLLVLLLASLDQTIVSTAMPRIIGEFNGLDRYTWVTTAYLLTSTVMIPMYGKLSDIFGRKIIFLIGIVLFLMGSAACGVAQNMNQLIVFRGFQGLGAAALQPIAMAVVGDLFTPRERGKWQGVTGAISGLSSVLGPAVGGFLTENISWRWVFYVNLPIGIAALLVLIFLMPELRGNVKQVRIDYPGALLLVVAVVPLLLGFTWAGHQYAWSSPQIIGLFIGSTIFFVLFFVYEASLERRDLQPILDPSMFKNGIFDISITMSMIISVSMFGSIFFLPLLAQGVMGISATNSGILLSPMMLALIFGTTTSGQLVSRTGKYKWLVILSTVMSVVGSLLFLRLGVHSSANDLWMSMIVLGLGIGFGIALYTVIIQNALPGKIGQATSALTFFRQIAATIALVAMGSLMTSAYVPAFHDALSPQVKQFAATVQEVRHIDLLRPFESPNILLSDEAKAKAIKGFQQLPGGMQIYDQLIAAVKVGLSHGIHDIFILDFCFSVASFLLVWFLKEIPLRGGKKQSKAGAMAQEREAAEGDVRSVPLH